MNIDQHRQHWPTLINSFQHWSKSDQHWSSLMNIDQHRSTLNGGANSCTKHQSWNISERKSFLLALSCDYGGREWRRLEPWKGIMYTWSKILPSICTTVTSNCGTVETVVPRCEIVALRDDNTVTLQYWDIVTPWYCDVATLRRGDTAILRHCDMATLRRCDTATLRHCDTVTLWQYDIVTLWHCDI